MVEYTYPLDNTFYALADATRRDMLERVSASEFSIGELAAKYNLTFAAISKHIKVLEQARLIAKRREGTKRFVRAVPSELQAANEYLQQYERIWQSRFNKLEEILNEGGE